MSPACHLLQSTLHITHIGMKVTAIVDLSADHFVTQSITCLGHDTPGNSGTHSI